MSIPKPSRGDVVAMLAITLFAAALAAGLVWTWAAHPELLEHAHFKRL